jgi:hypothetical protein
VTTPTRSPVSATGGMIFAAMIMVLAGFFQLIQGVASVAHDHLLIVRSGYTFRLDTTAWGWIHIILGIIVAIVGFGVLSAVTWARQAGIALAGLQALSSFFFVPYYPWWALTIIALDVLVIWALAAGSSATYREQERRDDPVADRMAR